MDAFRPKFMRAMTVALHIMLLSACKQTVLEEKGVREPEFPTIESSQTILFIHGMYLTPQAWAEWRQYFEERGYRTYAPAWPLHDLSIEEQNRLHPNADLGELRIEEVLNQYRAFLGTLDEKPIAIGHSMGGLIAQLLLEEDLISGAIALHSAPPFGVISAEPAFLKANWPMLNPLIPANNPIQLTFKQFQYGFTNGMTEAEQISAYEHMVPESRLIGRSTTTTATALERDAPRKPLLIVSGGTDRTITASLNYANFEAFRNTPAITDYKQFPERNHWTIKANNWESVADYSLEWIESNR
ncbi:alpha/beta hydrolase [Ketobacter alkanivorans]|uniref:AB hydrolase-1 domain-containing protein n=1 Tax=Ketobacter alkanivorans TaxID=1917421 RepID=A0A2K9LI96_9GAMM|nr:alpha/beta fold hydrolase [Ketobacter alkanivorans]AUM11983.1 hypothetical protein Kalk_05910 [Ketobacter alkanivorans]